MRFEVVLLGSICIDGTTYEYDSAFLPPDIKSAIPVNYEGREDRNPCPDSPTAGRGNPNRETFSKSPYFRAIRSSHST